ncbi:MAG: GNAT family N-acetyltransferase [Ruminococcus sp.]|nr:GNAT family N-acetyltransferase [Ruminococcus sp.]
MQITYTDSISLSDYGILEDAVGWTYNPEQFEVCIKNSAYVTAAYDGGRIVGAGRIVWDYGGDAYLEDLAVLPEYQGRGIGKALVFRVINYLENAIRPGWDINLDLIAANGKAPFYEKLGFEIRSIKEGGTAHMRMNIKKD